MPGCDPVQPDVVFIRAADLGSFHDRHIYGVPALLVEVLSPSNADVDLDTQRKAHARAGVPEYWIARPATLDDYTQTHLVATSADLVSPTLPVRAAVATFFAGAPDTTV